MIKRLLCLLFGYKFRQLPKEIARWTFYHRDTYCKRCGAINHRGIVYG